MKIRNILLLSILLFLFNCNKANDLKISIEPLKKYAIDYNPPPERIDGFEYYYDLPIPPDDVTRVLSKHKIDNEFIIYNTLIMLKLYRTHMEWAHKCYDIRSGTGKDNPILKAFSKYSGEKITGEFVPSHISYFWVLGKNEYNSNPHVRNEIKRIEIVMDNIEKGVYWN